jgi:hypothetical protein
LYEPCGQTVRGGGSLEGNGQKWRALDGVDLLEIAGHWLVLRQSERQRLAGRRQILAAAGRNREQLENRSKAVGSTSCGVGRRELTLLRRRCAGKRIDENGKVGWQCG